MDYWAPSVITRGVGQISAGALQQLVESAHAARVLSAAPAPPAADPQHLDHWLGRIIDATPIGTGVVTRWTYTLSRVELTADPSLATNYTTHPDTALGASVSALNLYEWRHSTGTLGDGTPVSSIPSGFTLVAVSGIVLVHTQRASDGTLLHLFERNNGVDGACA